MPTTLVALRHRRPVDYGTTPGTTTISRRGRDLFRRFVNLAQSALGANSDSDYALVYSATDPVVASGALNLSAAAGAVGTVINGVTLTATYATSDTNTAGLVASAINASTNALVAGIVTASNLAATLTLTSTAAGDTVDVCGYRFTAVSGIPVTIVSGGNLGKFDISGSDTLDAATLAYAINTMPGLSRFVAAFSSGAVVQLVARQFTFSGTATFAWPSGPSVPPNRLVSQASTIVASATSFAAGARVGVVACNPGVIGNCITMTATGTGASLVQSGSRLTNGDGLTALPIIDAA